MPSGEVDIIKNALVESAGFEIPPGFDTLEEMVASQGRLAAIAVQKYEGAAKECAAQKAGWLNRPGRHLTSLEAEMGKTFFQDKIQMEFLAYLCSVAELMGFQIARKCLEQVWVRAVKGVRLQNYRYMEEVAFRQDQLFGIFSEIVSLNLGARENFVYLQISDGVNPSVKGIRHSLYREVIKRIRGAAMAVLCSQLASVLWLVQFFENLDMDYNGERAVKFMAQLQAL